MKHKDCKYPERICRYIEGVESFGGDIFSLCDYCKHDKMKEDNE